VEVDIFGDRTSPVERVVLRDHSDRPSRKGWRAHAVDSGDPDRSFGRHRAGRTDGDGGGLAGAIRPQQPVDRTLLDVQVDAIHRNHSLFALVDLAQASNLNDHVASAHLSYFLHYKDRSPPVPILYAREPLADVALLLIGVPREVYSLFVRVPNKYRGSV